MVVSEFKISGSEDCASERGNSRENSVLFCRSRGGGACFTQQLLPDISLNAVPNLFDSFSAGTSAQCCGDNMSAASRYRPLLLPGQGVLVRENSLLHNLPPPTARERDDRSIGAIKQLTKQTPTFPFTGSPAILYKVLK